jgi:tetratricopeptide (TPR) repeat protein
MRIALAGRDISTVFRLLIAAGVSQTRIATLTRQGTSDVSEIVNGRQVTAVGLLERVATGLSIPRGRLGLAFDDPTWTCAGPVEVDDQVERRRFLALAGSVVFGQAVLGEPDELTAGAVPSRPPTRIGPADVRRLEQTAARLGVLDRELGGSAAREALAATARTADQLLAAAAVPRVHAQLCRVASEAHRLAGWAAGDAGVSTACRWHLARALELAGGDGERVAQVLASMADMEKHSGNYEHALKLLQLGQAAAGGSADPQVHAVLHGLSASAFLALGRADLATDQLRAARTLFAQAEPAVSLPFFAYYGPGYGLLAAVENKLGDYEPAQADVRAALRTRPTYDLRCTALDTVVLATVLLRAGELAEGMTQARRALALAGEMGSQRVLDRLAPLQSVLAAHRDSTCRDLAGQVCSVRRSTVPA